MPSAFPRAADPSVLFLLCCLLTPPLIEVYEGSFTWMATFTYVVHPLPIASIATTIVLLYVVHRGDPQISNSERMVATWYLVNGVGFKSLMDTGSGSLQSWSLMTDQYNALEKRYALSLWSDAESAPVHLSSLLEIMVQAPLCLWVYALIVRDGRSSMRVSVETVLCTLQAAGTWYFYLPLLLTSSSHRLAALFASADFMDVYFRGVFGCIICPCIWIVVPVCRIISLQRNLQKAEYWPVYQSSHNKAE